MKKIPICLLLLLFSDFLSAQSVIIPAFTGYAVPAESDEKLLFTEKYDLS